jgi:hypothetical protein
VDCPHCREALPELSTWFKSHADGINLVGAARIDNDAVKAKTEEFCKSSGLAFPTFIDADHLIGEAFLVVSTPTLVIVGPNGVVDSVLTTGAVDIPKKLEAKKKELLPPGVARGT